MAYEISNSRKGSSIVRCEGAATYTFPLNNFSSNTSLETVDSISIKRVNWSTGGTVTIARGATPNTVLTLYGSGEMRLDEYGHSLANGSTGNVVITIATGGSCLLELSKTATYSTDLDQL
jgi:hypothetical protein